MVDDEARVVLADDAAEHPLSQRRQRARVGEKVRRHHRQLRQPAAAKRARGIVVAGLFE